MKGGQEEGKKKGRERGGKKRWGGREGGCKNEYRIHSLELKLKNCQNKVIYMSIIKRYDKPTVSQRDHKQTRYSVS